MDESDGMDDNMWFNIKIHIARSWLSYDNIYDKFIQLTRPLERVWDLRALEGGIFCPPLLSRLPETLETQNLGE